MAIKKSGRGRYMDSWSAEKKREVMSLRASQKWAKMSEEDRRKFGRMLLKSRKK